MSEEGKPIGAPAIVSLFGHNTVAGWVSADTMFGDPMLRIDVPATSKQPPFTRHYGVKAVYEIDWCSEEVMLAAAEQAQVRPINVYVPTLVSRETHERVVAEMQETIERLLKGLPEPERGGDAARLDGEYDGPFARDKMDEDDDEEYSARYG
jgi:hypothetical protein